MVAWRPSFAAMREPREQRMAGNSARHAARD
jgi:hypothetical protein